MAGAAFKGFPSYPQRYTEALDPQPEAPAEVSGRVEPLRAPRDAVGIGRELVGKDLQRDIATETRIARAVDLPHPARADEGEDLVHAEPRTWRQRHCVGCADYEPV